MRFQEKKNFLFFLNHPLSIFNPSHFSKVFLPLIRLVADGKISTLVAMVDTNKSLTFTISNATGSYEVKCDPGFDGGLTQHFNLEVKNVAY